MHLLIMRNLPITHPVTHKAFINGKFVLKESDNSFNLIEPDHTIEKTLMRMSKTKGGLIGITKNKTALLTHQLSFHRFIQYALAAEQLVNSVNTRDFKSIDDADENSISIDDQVPKIRILQIQKLINCTLTQC